MLTNDKTSKALTEESPATTDDSITLAQRVAAQLRDMIAQDQLRPGERIRERHVAAQLQVSRTPMREALRLLAAEKLVEILPNRGAAVAAPSAREIKDLLSVLGMLEALAGEQAAERASDEEVAAIRALHDDMLAAFERDDRLGYFKCNQAIHHAIVQASKNTALIEMHAQTNARLYRVRYASNLGDGNWRQAVASHEQILYALATRDASRLSTILREHLNSTWEKVCAQLNVSPD